MFLSGIPPIQFFGSPPRKEIVRNRQNQTASNPTAQQQQQKGETDD
jgi:hypothetical protein